MTNIDNTQSISSENHFGNINYKFDKKTSKWLK
jgi:hypothetical protein